jgi:hypothetical protein
VLRPLLFSHLHYARPVKGGQNSPLLTPME